MMKQCVWLLIGCSLGLGLTRAQLALDWQDLQAVEFGTEKIAGQKYPITRVRFGEALQQRAGQEVRITGYVLPVDVEGNQYVLSAFPYASCFFCGGAGRESVVSLHLTPDQGPYELDERRSFVGRLRLVDAPYDLVYHLDQAREAR